MAERDLEIDRSRTAIVVIDLQKGITRREGKPYPVPLVVSNASRLVKAFRSGGMPVFLVHVEFSGGVPLRPIADTVMSGTQPAPDWAEFVPDLEVSTTDILITKRQWGAFYGTDLEQQLRRRHVETIVLCGIATTYGVESTARFAYEFGFNQIFPEDAMTDMSEEAHRVSVEYVLKRIGRVRSTEEILKVL
ncbi:MAG: isochorismatase family protein [Candidatus Thermoplasmatota archaeon]|jgi:nicotinamidase-related amidase|nr:isochorismatase family protein [Candidatus Thermoplasmatota archaeon]MCL5793950.1 isochorismatase family protein [Candidatus Thermoplasmatota archaeon]